MAFYNVTDVNLGCQGVVGQFAVAALYERRRCRGINTGGHRPPLKLTHYVSRGQLGIAWVHRIPTVRLKFLNERHLREMATLARPIMGAAWEWTGPTSPIRCGVAAQWNHAQDYPSRETVFPLICMRYETALSWGFPARLVWN